MSRSHQRVGEIRRGLLLLIGPILAVATISLIVSAVVIFIPDAGLEAAVRQAIGRPSGGISDYQLRDLCRRNRDSIVC